MILSALAFAVRRCSVAELAGFLQDLLYIYGPLTESNWAAGDLCVKLGRHFLSPTYIAPVMLNCVDANLILCIVILSIPKSEDAQGSKILMYRKTKTFSLS